MDDDFDAEKTQKSRSASIDDSTSDPHRAQRRGGRPPKRLGDMLPPSSGVKGIWFPKPLPSRLVARRWTLYPLHSPLAPDTLPTPSRVMSPRSTILHPRARSHAQL